MPSFTDLAVRPATVRWRDSRVVRSAAYRLGEVLAGKPRVLEGRVPTGAKIYLSSRDHQHRAIYFHQDYEPEVVALLRRHLTARDVFFDIGANAGYFSLIAADLGAQVHAFEPNVRVYALLNRSSADRPNMRICPMAASDREGVARLNLGDDTNTGQASLSIHRDIGIDVPVTPLDSYCERTGTWPTAVKIDVERHEDAVLRGAQRILREARPLAIIETESHTTVQIMRDAGYTVCRIQADGSTRPVSGDLGFERQYLVLAYVPECADRHFHVAGAHTVRLGTTSSS